MSGEGGYVMPACLRSVRSFALLAALAVACAGPDAGDGEPKAPEVATIARAATFTTDHYNGTARLAGTRGPLLALLLAPTSTRNHVGRQMVSSPGVPTSPAPGYTTDT